MANQITVVIDVDNKQAQKALRDFVKTTKGVEKGVQKSFTKMDGFISSFAGNLAANLAQTAFTGFVRGIKNLGIAAINQASKIEDLTTQITTLTGSASDAQAILEDLQEFAATTPFKLEGLAESTKLLLAFGNSQESIIPTLQILGDVAAGSGADLQELTRIFGQVQAAGKLTGERLLQFQERAIPIGPAIAKTLGVAESAVKDLVSAGAVTQEVFEEAFATLNKEGGKFANGMIRQSKTLSGVLSTLSDNVDLILFDIGKELLPIVKEIATNTITWIQANRELIKSFATDAVGTFKTALEGSFEIIKTTISLYNDTAEALGGVKVAFEEFTGLVDTDTLAGAIDKQRLLNKEIEDTQKVITRLEGQSAFANFFEFTKVETFKEKLRELKLEAIATDGIIKGLTKTGIKEDKEEQEKQDAADTDLSSFEAFLQKEKELQEKANADKAAVKQAFIDSQAEIQAEIDALELEAKTTKDAAELEAIGIQQEALLQKKAEGIIKEGKRIGSIQKKIEGTVLKNQKAFNKKREDEDKKFADQKIALEKKTEDAKLALIAGGLNAAASFAKDGSKAQFAIQKAAALASVIVSTITATNLALANPPGPPSTIPLAVATAAQGAFAASSIIASAVKGFQGGGIVPGSSFSGDNQLARVNSGELILNRRQQSNLFEAINNNQGGGGGGSNITIEGNLIVDDDSRVDELIDRINDRVEFGNTQLFSTQQVG